MSSVEVALIETTVAVEDNPALVAELQTMVADRLLYRRAIKEALQVAATGRIETALKVLRRAYPDAEVGAGDTAVLS